MAEDGWELGHRRALDGLRGVAILLVMLGHSLLWPAAAGAHFGVELFFVLSGFLITVLLLEEHVLTGRIGLAGFYRRRAVRLLPALAVFLGVFAFVVPPVEIGAAALYAMNYALVAGLQPEYTGHLWSLAVEEHFYLVWPLTLIALLRLGQERAMLATVALVAGAVVWRAVVAADDLGRVYHSTDTRIAAPLIGCALAFFVRAGYRPGRIAGMASAAAIGVLMVMPPAWAQEKWGVGLLAAEVSMAVLIASCLRGDGIGRVLSMRAFTMTGRLSYGLYLWHLPIVLVLGPMGGLTVLETVLVFVLSYAAAGTSMRLVERPLSRFRRTAPPRSADRPALSAHA